MANAHSLYRYDDLRFWGLGFDLYRDGSIIFSGFDGSRLAWARMPPSLDPNVMAVGIKDYLFIAGGGDLIKVDPLGATSDWGIDPPPDGFTATVGTPTTLVIDGFESAAGWTASGSGVSVADEATIKLEGTNSMKMVVPKRTTGMATKAITLDCSQFVGGLPITNADYVEFQIRADFPERIDLLQVQFSLGNATFVSDFYSRTIPVESQKRANKKKGLATLPEITDSERVFVVDAVNTSPAETDNLLVKASDSFMTLEVDAWTLLQIPVAAFQRSGNGAVGWADVQGVRLIVKTNSRGPVTVYWDAGQITGGSGLQGRYRYYITYLNNTTGHRSNPNPTYVEVQDVQREVVTLANFPTPTDSQVSHIEIWRTVGDGSIPFFVAKIDLTATTFDDDYGDYDGIVAGSGDALSTIALLFDNNKPFDSLGFCLAPHVGRMWWCNDRECGHGGRVYYSGVGRPEAMSAFLDVTDADDQTLALAVWNGSIYCIAESGIFEILGTDEPFIPRKVFGAPGMKDGFEHSFKQTPHGIAYQSHDGVRIFDGNFSKLLFFDSVSRIMQGETAEGISDFKGEVATYGRDEYYIADPTNVTLACNLEEGRWRNCGIDANALHFQDDTGDVIGAYLDQILGFEVPNELTDAGIPIPFEAQTPATLLEVGQVVRVGFVVVDALTNDEQLTAELELDGVVYPLGLVQTTVRVKTELPVDRTGRVASVRLTGSLSNVVEIFHIEAIISVGGQNVKRELFDPNVTYTGLWLGYGNDITPRFGLRRNKSVHRIKTQTIRSRPGSKLLGADFGAPCSTPVSLCCPDPFTFAQAEYDGDILPGGPAVRVPSSATVLSFTGYAAVYDPNQQGGLVILGRWLGTAKDHLSTVLGAALVTLAPGDILRIEADGNDLSVFVNGNSATTTPLIGPITDTNIPTTETCTDFVTLAPAGTPVIPPISTDVDGDLSLPVAFETVICNRTGGSYAGDDITGGPFNGSTNSIDAETFSLASMVSNTPQYGFCILRVCCPQFKTNGTTPQGVVVGDQYCNYVEGWFTFDSFTGAARVGIPLFVAEGSTRDLFTGYVMWYDHSIHKIGISRYNAEPLSTDGTVLGTPVSATAAATNILYTFATFNTDPAVDSTLHVELFTAGFGASIASQEEDDASGSVILAVDVAANGFVGAAMGLGSAATGPDDVIGGSSFVADCGNCYSGVGIVPDTTCDAPNEDAL